jgi:hypothetical protein
MSRFRGRRLLTATRRSGRLRSLQSPLEFGGDRIEVPLERIDLPGREQTVQSGASCSYGVSKCAGASLAGIIRGGRLESGEPILERGYLA